MYLARKTSGDIGIIYYDVKCIFKVPFAAVISSAADNLIRDLKRYTHTHDYC